MAFETDFATSLGEALGVQLDEWSFGNVDETFAQIKALKDFLDGLDDVSRQTLEAVTEVGIDPSAAVDEDGNAVNLPGGALLGLAARVGRGLTAVVTLAESNYEVARANNPEDTDEAGRLTERSGA